MESAVKWKLLEGPKFWSCAIDNLNHLNKAINLSIKYLGNYLKNFFLILCYIPEDLIVEVDYLINYGCLKGLLQKEECAS
jgi:hypothetical protein